ncbi:Pre-mRNA-splicing factor cwc26 [Thecaphora frezii]
MPDPKLQAYLAQHYLSGPKADAILARAAAADPDIDKLKKKKKRRIHPTHPSVSSSSSSSSSPSVSAGLVLKDDSDAWKTVADPDQDDEGGAFAPQVIRKQAGAGFKKATWSSVSKAQGTAASETDGASAEAEATPTPPPPAPSTEAPIKAGLKTREEMRAQRLAREAQQRSLAAASPPSSSPAQPNRTEEAQRPDQETVYRDSSGRRIDVKAEQEAQRRQALEAAQKQRERDEWGKGLVQRQQRQEEAQRIQRMKSARVEQRADDDDVAHHFKEKQHWDDPALAFMAKKRPKGPQKPKYTGPPPPPNRFGIAPGYRWDGVDRSNGFEKVLFQRKNELARRAAEGRAWRQEDM